MTEEMRRWAERYRALVAIGAWITLIDHVRANVNLSKEVLLSVDSDVQRELHTDCGGFAAKEK